MRAEEMMIRSEIRQMLNEAGINRETLKPMIQETIRDVVKNQVSQIVMEKRNMNLDGVVSDYCDNMMYRIIKDEAERQVRSRLNGWRFKVNVAIVSEDKEHGKSGID